MDIAFSGLIKEFQQTGFTDTVAVIREVTVRSIGLLAPHVRAHQCGVTYRCTHLIFEAFGSYLEQRVTASPSETTIGH